MNAEAYLFGFVGRPVDLRDRIRLCHPVLSPDGQGSKLYVARSLDWAANEERSLKHVDKDEVSWFGTLFADGGLKITSGCGVVVMGSDFERRVMTADISNSATLSFRKPSGLECRVALAARDVFERYVGKLVREARNIFDEEVLSIFERRDLSEAGKAASFVLRKAPLRREADVAMRELAEAYLKPQPDLFRRLLAHFASELKDTEKTLHDRMMRYVDQIRAAALERRSLTLTRFVAQERESKAIKVRRSNVQRQKGRTVWSTFVKNTNVQTERYIVEQKIPSTIFVPHKSITVPNQIKSPQGIRSNFEVSPQSDLDYGTMDPIVRKAWKMPNDVRNQRRQFVKRIVASG